MEMDKKLVFCLLLILGLATSGCWDYQEINDLAIVLLPGGQSSEEEFSFWWRLPSRNRWPGTVAAARAARESPLKSWRAWDPPFIRPSDLHWRSSRMSTGP